MEGKDTHPAKRTEQFEVFIGKSHGYTFHSVSVKATAPAPRTCDTESGVSAVAACRHKLTARYFRLADLADEFDATADAAYERKALLEELTKPAVSSNSSAKSASLK